MLLSLKPAHVTNCLFPNSCCVTLLPTPWDVACHSFNGLSFTGKCLGEPLSSLISNRRGQSFLEVAVKHLWDFQSIREAEKGPFSAGKTLTFIQYTVQGRGLKRWGGKGGDGTCRKNGDGLPRQERSICEGRRGRRWVFPRPSQVVHHFGNLSFTWSTVELPHGLAAGGGRSEVLLRSALRCFIWLLLIKFRN